MCNYSLDELIRARDKSAEIVVKYGEKYLPIFERMEKEVELKRQKKKLLNKVHEIVTQNVTHIGTQESV